MKMQTKKLVVGTLAGSIVALVMGVAVADVTVRLRSGHSFVVEDRGSPTDDNFIVQDKGRGVIVPRGPLDIKNGTAGGQEKFFEGSAGGTNSVTVKSPDALDADVVLTLPVDDGDDGEVLSTNGSGVLSWVANGGGTSEGAGCVNFTITDTTEVVPTTDMLSGGAGRIWMDRNMGATRASLNATDTLSYGSLIQWGRAPDGHGCGTIRDETWAGPVDASETGNAWDGMFITVASAPNNWYDGTGTEAANDLWQNGLNDPCPTGYRIPTEAELQPLATYINGGDELTKAFNLLGLSVGGYRRNNGALNDVGSDGLYWSSTVSGTEARYLLFRATSAGMVNTDRARGHAVRCIKPL